MIIGVSKSRRKWKSAQTSGKQGLVSIYGLGTFDDEAAALSYSGSKRRRSS